MVTDLVVKSDAAVVGWLDGGWLPGETLAIDERRAGQVGIYRGIEFFHPCKDSISAEGDTLIYKIVSQVHTKSCQIAGDSLMSCSICLYIVLETTKS